MQQSYPVLSQAASRPLEAGLQWALPLHELLQLDAGRCGPHFWQKQLLLPC